MRERGEERWWEGGKKGEKEREKRKKFIVKIGLNDKCFAENSTQLEVKDQRII